MDTVSVHIYIYICTKLSTDEWNVEPPSLVLPNWLKVDNS